MKGPAAPPLTVHRNEVGAGLLPAAADYGCYHKDNHS